MSKKWDERLEAFDAGDPWPILRWGLKILFGCFIVGGLIIWPVGCVFGWFGSAATVVRQETDPRVMLNRYMWFKDAHAALDAKQATIKTYQARERNLRTTYGEPVKWPRDVRQEWSLEESEAAGIIASYNTLAADYNAQMAKINWRFTNVGDLPAGATEPLPRQYAPYQENP